MRKTRMRIQVLCVLQKVKIDDLKLSRKIDFTEVEQYLTRYTLSLQEEHLHVYRL